MNVLIAMLCESSAALFRTPAPLTPDIVRKGMISVVADDRRMKSELLPRLIYPTSNAGLNLL